MLRSVPYALVFISLTCGLAQGASPNTGRRAARHAGRRASAQVEPIAPEPSDDAPADSSPDEGTVIASDEPEVVATPERIEPDSGNWESAAPMYTRTCNSCYRPYGCAHGLYGRVEFIEWWVRGANLPPLVTTSIAGTPQAQAGILPNATVVIGDESVDFEGRSGARSTIGYWFNDCETRGIEVTAFGLNQSQTTLTASSDDAGSPILARPFFNTVTQAESARLVAYPLVFSGSVDVTTLSKTWGAEVNFRRALCRNHSVRWDAIGGYRFYSLDETLDVEANTVVLDSPPIQPGTIRNVTDHFGATNKWNGGQFGLLMTYQRCRWSMDVATKLGIGGIRQEAQVSGQSVTTLPDQAPVTVEGGFLALASNSGTWTRNQFSLMPEVSFNLRYQITPIWQFNVGYNFLAVTNVARPGDLVNLNINPGAFPPPTIPVTPSTPPVFAFNNSDVWLQGINLGLECNF